MSTTHKTIKPISKLNIYINKISGAGSVKKQRNIEQEQQHKQEQQ